ncbi:MAG: type II toxin-antitoxin system RatA family toxin [Porticoccaceae bacterium]|nr:type II toxin-antitoxin system RatA family toxin [Porticoccaceae bacterium]MDP4653892.1 type II toxin-antitoxin system RatA family toxin [Alphaproteobacteria bacterium]MDP4743294.1 type II toxin-antitoxin system RatA family toxin [Porticoccaceae bacterium]MDP4752152.1 type II toxin-antitoxin system RatA family toxin [Porticoccaceae bacterium]MDP4889394.1 type II toxin-antitoxin system RatA family toxin [Porticoccaceae bacterium]
MNKVQRSALVMHSDQSMFDLVNDVANYPLFMDGCQATEVFEKTDSLMVARLDLKKGGVKTSFMTRNRLTQPSSIEMALEDGPFKNLKGLWTFKALTADACKVSLDLEFEFNNMAMGFAASQLFSSMANNLVDSLCRRADVVYGKKHD